MATPPKNVLSASLSNYHQPLSRVAGQSEQALVPDRWAPSGWKYVASDHKPAFFNRRYARERPRLAQHPSSCSPSRFQTTNQSHFPSPGPSQCMRSSREANQFPPLPSDKQFIDSVLHSSFVKKSPSMPLNSQRNWVAEWVGRKAFHKRRHIETEWMRMYLSSGTIK